VGSTHKAEPGDGPIGITLSPIPGATRIIPGDVAFLLHDTYGFPLDLTQVIAKENGFSVDVESFDKLMEEQRARGSFAGSG
jgi:alanyl-tRNA synthetase